jgi:UDP-N-acetylmuramate dehydrogenase
MDLPLFILGGGSNIVVSDRGWRGLVLRLRDERCSFAPDGDAVIARVGAGLDWDSFVSVTVGMGLAGLECMSGIPGFVGGAPIQNVGAYGQEVSETIVEVQFIDRPSGALRSLGPDECGFSYRQSRFKQDLAESCLVTEVHFRLSRTAPPTLRYPELQRRAAELVDGEISLAALRDLVLDLRGSKAMLVDPDDPNTRSVGSFFVNPQLDESQLSSLEACLDRRGLDPAAMPRYPGAGGLTKVPAAWLIEQAGFHKGQSLGPAAISSRHSLAVVNRGGARAVDILALAGTIRRGVRGCFDLTLQPEPRFIGFDHDPAVLLDEGPEKG